MKDGFFFNLASEKKTKWIISALTNGCCGLRKSVVKLIKLLFVPRKITQIDLSHDRSLPTSAFFPPSYQICSVVIDRIEIVACALSGFEIEVVTRTSTPTVHDDEYFADTSNVSSRFVLLLQLFRFLAHCYLILQETFIVHPASHTSTAS